MHREYTCNTHETPDGRASTDTQRFLELLYSGAHEGYLLLSWPSPTRRHTDGRQALESHWYDLATTPLARIAAHALALSPEHNVYYGVAIQHPSRQPNPFQRSRNGSAYVLPGLYCDIDLASGAHAASALPPTTADALAFLTGLPSKPSLILHTGGGIHGYWLFEAPVWLLTETDRTAMAHLLQQFAHTLCQAGKVRGWDLDNLRDLARILRPPGTINHKYGTPVEIIAGSDQRYALADFDWLVPLPEPSVHRQRQTPSARTSAAGVSDQPDLVTVVETYGTALTKKSSQEWHGAHPTHGSSTGTNLDCNTGSQLWHCWRHGTGGDAFTMIAICEGMVACEDVQPGCLSGARFPQVLEVAQCRFGWQPPPAQRSPLRPLAIHLPRGLSTALRRSL